MDDLLREFLTETNESLDRVDAELVRFEQEPNNGEILGDIFRLVHTIKGTCGFLGLPRLEALAHSAENLMGEFRDGMPVTTEAVPSFSPPSIASRPFSKSSKRSSASRAGMTVI
jgi:two-component system chemotaxis sensor kinase CheA